MAARRALLATAVAGVVSVAMAACGHADGPVAPVVFTFSQADQATDVSPATAVEVRVSAGTIVKATLTDSRGDQVDGEVDSAGRQWHATADLSYNRDYTLDVTAQDGNGVLQHDSRQFSTVSPTNQTLVYFRTRDDGPLLDGGTFGIGQPIVAWFDSPVTDKAAAERSLRVTTDPPVTGSWYWMPGDDHEAHWRPQEYWPAHTTVTVAADIFGVRLGDGLYGQQDQTATFTIGAAHLAQADSSTHRMKVFVDGAQVTTIAGNDVTDGIPVSIGREGGAQAVDGSWVDFRTSEGPHVVLGKVPTMVMNSASFGIVSGPYYYDDTQVLEDVQLSKSGEYVHYAPWNPEIGDSNTSHGCVNVDKPYIDWFYDTFDVGDVVEVLNTGKTLGLTDGLGDWTVSWDDWLKGSAL